MLQEITFNGKSTVQREQMPPLRGSYIYVICIMCARCFNLCSLFFVFGRELLGKPETLFLMYSNFCFQALTQMKVGKKKKNMKKVTTADQSLRQASKWRR